MDIVQLSWQAKVVQPLQGKGYLDNEREMRIFLPRPALIALGRMQMSVQLYLEVKQDLIRPRSAEGSSAKLPGLTSCAWGPWGHLVLSCHRLEPGSEVAPQPWYPPIAQLDSLMWALLTVCGAGGQSPWGERVLCPASDSWGPLSPSIPWHIASYCPAVMSARSHSMSAHPSWPKVCH